MRRLPAGYRGINHETIGSDILSVVKTMKLPVTVLGEKKVTELSAIRPDGWYPIGILLELFEQIDKKLGDLGLKQIGRTLFKMSHSENLQKNRPKNAQELLHGFDNIYRSANRGTEIGGWKVTSFNPGRAELAKNTPHHCAMEEGLMSEALISIGITAHISQSACFRKGADHCTFVITSPFVDEHWMPKKR